MPPTYKIALIQCAPKPSNAYSNFAVAATRIRAAASHGADLAVLPEYHLTGWFPEDPEFITVAVQWKSWIEEYRKLAHHLHINIVPGTIVQATSSDSTDSSTSKARPNLLNVSTFISSAGEILGTYTKRNLWHPERPHLTPSPLSEPHTVISTPLGPVGILVCWDLAFPEAFRSLVRQGAKIIIVPAFWTNECSYEGQQRNPNAEALFLESSLTTRAFENTCCVVFVNAGGKEEDGMLGLSQVTMPFLGKLDGSFTGCEEGYRFVEVDLEILEEAERNYKVREDMSRENWHYGLP